MLIFFTVKGFQMEVRVLANWSLVNIFLFGWFKGGFALYHVQDLLQTYDLVTYVIHNRKEVSNPT